MSISGTVGPMPRDGQYLGPPRDPETSRAAWLGRAFLALVGGVLFWLFFAGVASAEVDAEVPGSESAATEAVPDVDPARVVTEAVDGLQPQLPETPPTGVDQVDEAVGAAEGSAQEATRNVWPDAETPGALEPRAAHRAPTGAADLRAAPDAPASSLSEVDTVARSAGDWQDARTYVAPGDDGAPGPGTGQPPEPALVASNGAGQAAVLGFAWLPAVLVAREQRRRRSGATRSRSAKPAVSPD